MLVWGGLNADAVDPSGIPVITRIAFIVGAVLSLSTILWSVLRVPELPLSAQEIAAMRAEPLSARTTLRDLKQAIVEMPVPMRQLAIAMLFQWYAMFCYWQFVAFAIARSLYHTADSGSAGFRQAVLVNGQIGGFYNFIAFIAAFAMVPIARKMGARPVHAVSVAASGIAMLALPYCSSQAMLFIPMIGIGLGWASMMGNPYIVLADSIPLARTGIYMGIFNMFIVIPMMIESLTMPLIYRPLLGGDPRHVLMLAGVLMLLAAVATLAIRERPAARTAIPA